MAREITGSGLSQNDLINWMKDVDAAIDELITDHATMRTEVIAIGTTLADVKAIYDAHTHECPGSSFAASRCSTPDTGAAENSLAASAASAITDTSGSSVPAALTAVSAVIPVDDGGTSSD
jgi:hypothetical protein